MNHVHRKNYLGTILRQQRMLAAMSLKDLSVASGISVSHLYRIEKGERFPSAHTLSKLAVPLGLNEIELFRIVGYLSAQPDIKVKKFSNNWLG